MVKTCGHLVEHGVLMPMLWPWLVRLYTHEENGCLCHRIVDLETWCKCVFLVLRFSCEKRIFSLTCFINYHILPLLCYWCLSHVLELLLLWPLLTWMYLNSIMTVYFRRSRFWDVAPPFFEGMGYICLRGNDQEIHHIFLWRKPIQ
jgi:hypothetical protein